MIVIYIRSQWDPMGSYYDRIYITIITQSSILKFCSLRRLAAHIYYLRWYLVVRIHNHIYITSSAILYYTYNIANISDIANVGTRSTYKFSGLGF